MIESLAEQRLARLLEYAGYDPCEHGSHHHSWIDTELGGCEFCGEHAGYVCVICDQTVDAVNDQLIYTQITSMQPPVKPVEPPAPALPSGCRIRWSRRFDHITSTVRATCLTHDLTAVSTPYDQSDPQRCQQRREVTDTLIRAHERQRHERMIMSVTSANDNTKSQPTAVLYLDLDGAVRQGKDDALGKFVNGAQDVRVFDEAVAMMRAWKAKGGRIVGVTNQGGIAMGHVTRTDVVAAIQETQRRADNLFDKIVFCPHHPDADDPMQARCWCRKPQPGLLAYAVGDLERHYPDECYPVSLALMVGDRDEDERCAAMAGIEFLAAADWRATGAEQLVHDRLSELDRAIALLRRATGVIDGARLAEEAAPAYDREWVKTARLWQHEAEALLTRHGS